MSLMQADGLRSRNGMTSRRSKTISSQLVKCRRVGRTRFAIEKRDLTEYLTGSQIGENDLSAFDGRQRDTNGADNDRHHAVAPIIEPAYTLAGGVTARPGVSGDFAARFLIKGAE